MSLSLINGTIRYSKSPLTNGVYPVDTIASFTCNHGYSISASEYLTCQINGTWDKDVPICTQGKHITSNKIFSDQISHQIT